MKTLQIVFFVTLFSMNAYAQDEKGFFFTLGEKIMQFGGYSYLGLEKKFMEKEKELRLCTVAEAQSKFVLQKKEEELVACKSGGFPAASESPNPAVAPAPTITQ
jgi:hypothetical protein